MFYELPGVFVSLGMMQRTKWGWVVRKLDISLFRFSCKTEIISNFCIISVLKVIWLCWKVKIQNFLLPPLVSILQSCVGISKVNGYYWRTSLLSKNENVAVEPGVTGLSSQQSLPENTLTRKRTETVWKEEPFFLVPFFFPPSSAGKWDDSPAEELLQIPLTVL